MSKRRLTFVCGVVALAVLGGALVAHAQPAKPDKDGWISLFNGKDLSGWHVRGPKPPNSWTVVDGVLTNAGHGIDLVTDKKFGDIELHVEFKIPAGSNSGVYLQGRYEVQVLDSFGQPPKDNGCGGIYKKVAPTENACKPVGEWEVFDIKFVAATLGADGTVTKNSRLTLVHNGKLVIDDAEVDGPTGGELDKNNGHPGPVYIQGNHGAIEVRSVKYRPLKAAEGT
jgi:hypothetical protein